MVGGSSLQISNLTEGDAGTYTCLADNGNETIQAQAELTIQGLMAFSLTSTSESWFCRLMLCLVRISPCSNPTTDGKFSDAYSSSNRV